jgi:hypothetical protein
MVTGLRSLLRYLHVACVIQAPLRWAVLSRIAENVGWRSAKLSVAECYWAVRSDVRSALGDHLLV